MKVRSGYVSNSSSSSFCIVGVFASDVYFDVDSVNVRQLLVDEGFEKDEVDEMDVPEIINSLYEHFYGKRHHEKFGDIVTKRGIENYSADDVIVGLDIEKMNDDETLGQFKDKVCEQLKGFGFTGSRDDIKIFIDGGYEG